MFTGIIEHVCTVIDVHQHLESQRLCVRSPWEDVKTGESIAVNGVCLTALCMDDETMLWFDVSPETLHKTQFKQLQKGDDVHLERAMPVGGRFGGHYVSGHVDTVATLRTMKKIGHFVHMTVDGFSNQDMRYLLPKGSIALNGVSLTINAVFQGGIELMLVPHTLKQTTFDTGQPGQLLNVEFDYLARIVVHQLGFGPESTIIASSHRMDDVLMLEPVVTSRIPLKSHGDFMMTVFRDTKDGAEHFILEKKVTSQQVPLVRIHSECLTGDLLGSSKCDCGDQLEQSLALIGQSGGVLIYLRQEGRGIGLVNKLKAYVLQDKGLDTVEANEHLGLPVDGRDYEVACHILNYLGINHIRLLTNNPQKVAALTRFGIHIQERVGLVSTPTAENCDYLKVKQSKLGHYLNFRVEDTI